MLSDAPLPPEVAVALRPTNDPRHAVPELPEIELLEVIGRGGAGRVWKGRIKATSKLVAVKVLTGGVYADAKQQERFLREVEILSRLEHPGLIRLSHFGVTADGYYFSMDYLPAGSLVDERLRRGPDPWPIRRTVEVATAVARAVQHAHEQKVIHRDLKPGNILLAADGRPVLADFGIAKLLTGPDTTGTTSGTPCYMAPEQATGRPADVRTDVYGLGAVLYDLLTGGPPVPPGESDANTIRRVADPNVHPVPPRVYRPEVSADLDRVVLKCLEKNPAHRYPSAHALADELDRVLAGQPVLVRPLDPVSRATRWVRRKPLYAALLAAVAVGVLASLTAALFAAHATRERARRVERDHAISELLLSAGSPTATVRLIDGLAASGEPVPVRLRVALVQALTATGDADRSATELARLPESEVPAESRGNLHLLRASLATSDDSSARRWIEAARAETLSPDDAAFADGLLADTTPDAIRHLERAVGLNSRHVPARVLLAQLLLLGGRVEEAIRSAEQSRLLFADHPAFPLAIAVGAGFRGDRERAATAVAVFAALRPADEAAAVRALVDALPVIQAEIRFQLYGPELGHPEPPAADRVRLRAAVGQFRTVAPRLGGMARLPLALRPAIAFVFRHFARMLGDASDPIPVGGRVIAAADLSAFAAAVDRHPEAVATMLLGQGLVEASTGDKDLDRYRTELARSARSFADAARRPGWLDVRDVALEHAAVFYSVAGAPRRPFPVAANRDWLTAGADAARRRWELGGVTPPKLAMLVRVTANAGRYPLARVMLDDLEQTTPGNPAVDGERARLEFKAGNHALALAAAEKYLAKHPDDADVTAIRDACRPPMK